MFNIHMIGLILGRIESPMSAESRNTIKIFILIPSGLLSIF